MRTHASAVIVGLLFFFQVGSGFGQEEKSNEERIQMLEMQLEQIRQNLQKETMGMKPSSEKSGRSLFQVGASITIRYDLTEVEDQTDLLLEDNEVTGFRTRTRFSLKYNPEGRLAAGLRLSTGENPNPASPFIRLGNAFRSKSFDIDRFFIIYQPLNFYDDLSFTLGKMPNPFWLGDRGPFRTEMIWDTDVNPEGITLSAGTPKGFLFDIFQIKNTTGYFSIYEATDLRFSGLTGDTYLLANQFRINVDPGSLGGMVEPGSVGGAVSVTIYDFENINAGLRSPNFTPGSGAFVEPGTSAFLLTPGLQRTNNRVSYGPGAIGFIEDEFAPLVITSQVYFPLPEYWFKPMGIDLNKPEMFVLGDYVENLSFGRDDVGYGITAGLRGGGKGFINPFNIWYTYRDVGADATLSTFADSDLGAGTGYQGFEFVVNYKILPDLLFQFVYLDFEGFPNEDNSVTRMFFDLVRNF